jgi:hypothetical protein
MNFIIKKDINFLITLLIFFSFFIIFSCTKYKPFIQNNITYQNLGEARTKYEIDLCIEEADELTKNQIATESFNQSSDNLVKSIGNSISQAIIGNSNPTSSFLNNSIRSSGTGVSSVIKTYNPNNQSTGIRKKNLIARCLALKGLLVIGWK